MSEYHFPVPGSPDEKEIVVFVHRHWAAYLGQFALSIFLLLLPLVIYILVKIFSPNSIIFSGIFINFLVLGMSVYYLVAFNFAFVAWLSFYYNIYIVTKTEIIEVTQVGYFGRKIAQLSLLRVQDVTSEIKGILPTLFAYGNVLVETAGEQKETFLLESIPNPQEICAKIMELHDRIIEEEGRHRQILEGEGALAPGLIEPKKAEPILPKTSYQELLEKEKQDEGEIPKEDLTKGGEIEFKK